MAINLVKAGHAVTGFDLAKSQADALVAAGGKVAASAVAAAAGAEVVITMLPASRHVEAVYLGSSGLIAAASPKTLLIDCSTIALDIPLTAVDPREINDPILLAIALNI